MLIENLLSEENQKINFDDLKLLNSFLNEEIALTQADQLIDIYKKFVEKFEIYPAIYFSYWFYFRKIGKIQLSETSINHYIDFLIKYKRVPKLKEVYTTLENNGYSKTKLKSIRSNILILLGDKETYKLSEIDLFDWHEDHWSSKSIALKNEILSIKKWNLELVTKAYEYTLKYYFDLDLAEIYKEKILANSKYKEDFVKLLVKFKEPELRKNINEAVVNYKVDYDQLAFDLISGSLPVNAEEERKVIASIELMSYDELVSKGEDMLIAFKMLNMNLVVRFLTSRLLEFELSARSKASIAFICAQSFFEDEMWFELSDFITKQSMIIPYLEDELLAMEYLNFQGMLKAKRIVDAKKIGQKILRTRSQYRDVANRLKEIEKNK